MSETGIPESGNRHPGEDHSIRNPATGRLFMVGCSGAFDRLHDGHRAILRKAFEIGDTVGIIVFEMPGLPEYQPVDVRLANLRDFIASLGANGRAEYFFADTDDALETRWKKMEVAKLWLNPKLQAWVSCTKDIEQVSSIFPSVLAERERLALYSNPSALVLIDPVLQEDGSVASSSSLRQAEGI